MNTERLLTLAKHLESIHENPKPGFIFDLMVFKVEDSCGTKSCAIGEACTIPEFAQDGLYLRKTPYERGDKLGESHYLVYYQSKDDGQIYTEIRAIEKFFDISEHLARKLFYPRKNEDYEYVKTTALEVAQDIRRVVAEEECSIAMKEWKALPKKQREEVIASLYFKQAYPKPESVELTIKLLRHLSESV